MPIIVDIWFKRKKFLILDKNKPPVKKGGWFLSAISVWTRSFLVITG
jgi:hypothetical protein